MFQRTKQIIGNKIAAQDGDLGKVDDLLFDDMNWTVRYFVLDTGGWLPGRKILISPVEVMELIPEEKHAKVKLTQEQIRNSPTLESNLPVGRQFEAELVKYYGWPGYWPAMYGSTMQISPGIGMADASLYGQVLPEEEDLPDLKEKEGRANLRSIHEVKGYAIQAADGKIGHVEDFIVQTADWNLSHLEVDTRNWWPGKKVLVPSGLMKKVDWGMKTLEISVSKNILSEAPEYDPDEPLTAEFLGKLHDYYRDAGWFDKQE